MSSTIKVSISDSIKSFVEKQVEEGFETPSDYICYLIRKDKEAKDLSDYDFLRKELSAGVLAEEDDFVEVSAQDVLNRCNSRKKA